MISRKEDIIIKSAKLFRRKGYAATSMQDIAQEVGVKAASLYNHIQSKNEILEIILLDVANSFVNEMDAIQASSLDSLKKIERLVGLHVRLTVERTDQMAMLIGDWTHLEPKPKKAYLELRNQYEQEFKKIIKDCIADGHFKNLNAEIASFSILSTLRWTYSWYRRNKHISPVDLEDQLYKILIEGLTI